MARMIRFDFRLPAELKAAAEAEAAALGLDLSEFIRHSLIVRCAQLQAMRSMGTPMFAPPETLPPETTKGPPPKRGA